MNEEQRARHNAKNKEWAKNNPEKMREARKRWITANPEKNKAMQKEIQHRSYIKHREEIRGRQKILNMKRKEKVVIDDFLECPFIDTREYCCNIRIFTHKSWCDGLFQEKYIGFVNCPLKEVENDQT